MIIAIIILGFLGFVAALASFLAFAEANTSLRQALSLLQTNPTGAEYLKEDHKRLVKWGIRWGTCSVVFIVPAFTLFLMYGIKV